MKEPSMQLIKELTTKFMVENGSKGSKTKNLIKELFSVTKKEPSLQSIRRLATWFIPWNESNDKSFWKIYGMKSSTKNEPSL